MKTNLFFQTSLFISVFFINTNFVNAQIKYERPNKLTMGNPTVNSLYNINIEGGIYLTNTGGKFLQFDSSYSNPRIAGSGNEVAFYNSTTKTFNSIQVENVFNYSDARAKTNIQSCKNGKEIVLKLKPVTYNFKDGIGTRSSGQQQIGLLAQDVEAILPNLVVTDEEGKKLINYTALIPILIDAIQTLQAEVDTLKNK